MTKILSGLLIFWSVISWGKPEPLTYGDLGPRLLLQATADTNVVEPNPELMQPPTEKTVPLYLSKFHPKGIIKGHSYRLILIRTYDTYGTDVKKSNIVYNLTVEELDEHLQPTGTQLELAAKSNPTVPVANFVQTKDQLSQNPTLQTGRAQVGDRVINALPTTLNNQKIPAYTRFDVVGISKEHIAFTLSYKYTLKLSEVRTKKTYTLAAPGLRSLPIWTLVVAPQNRRVFKFWGIEAHY